MDRVLRVWAGDHHELIAHCRPMPLEDVFLLTFPGGLRGLGTAIRWWETVCIPAPGSKAGFGVTGGLKASGPVNQ